MWASNKFFETTELAEEYCKHPLIAKEDILVYNILTRQGSSPYKGD